MRFPNTYCSQCGREFGPGDHGYSHCSDHTKPLDSDSSPAEIAVRAIAVSDWREFRSHFCWSQWCREIAEAADQGDRALVNELTTVLDRTAR